MVQPIDYLGMLPQVDLGQQLVSGLQAGAGLRAVRDERQAKEDAQKLQAQYSADLQQALSNPTPQNFAALTAKYPQQREAFKQSWEMLDKGQQDAEFGAGVKVYSALRNGRPDAAMQVLDEQITAMENSGQDVADLQGIRAQIQRDPNSAIGHIGLVLSSTDPDRWSKISGEQRSAEQAPYELSEKQAKAQKAAVDARFAESMAVQDLAKKGWDIAKIQNDIGVSQQNSKIAAMNAQLGRETNDLKRQELQQKVQDAQLKRDESIRGKTAEVETARAQADNLLSTVDKLLKNPSLPDVLGSIEGGMIGDLTRFDDEEMDAIASIDTLGSQITMSRIGEMKGALSNQDLEVLRSSLQSLNRKQSVDQFNKNLSEVQRLTLKARSSLADKYGVPDVMPDRPSVDAQPASSGFKVLGRE